MFFDRFKALCIEQNASPNAVAPKIGVSSGTITNWGNGRLPKVDALIKVSQFFGVSTDYLLGLSDNRNESSAQVDSFLSKEERTLIDNFRQMKRDDQLREGARIQLLAEQATGEADSKHSGEAM